MAEKRAWLAACIAWLLLVTCGCSLSVPSKFNQNDPTNDFDDASDGDELVLDQFVPDIDFDIYDTPFTDDPGPPDHGPEVIDTVAEEPSTTCNPADCPLGCHPAEPRCNRLNPSNYDPILFHDAIDGGLAPPGAEDIHVNTDDGSIRGSIEYRPAGSPGSVLNGIYWNIVDQPGGLPVAVFGMKSLDLPAGAIMHVVGGHAAAFYIRDNANISGIIEARAGGRQGGAGGGMGGEKNGANGDPCGDDSHGKGGGQDGSGDDQIEAGGGGGGARGTGGNGGNAVYSTYLFGPGGAGGNAIMGESLVPLTGGCGGGAGGGPETAGNSYRGGDGGYGGGGGGAIQISAGGSISISMGAGINVPGAGGQGGLYGAGGGGGGAGGGVLLEAATISNAGLLAANGGGGGAGGAHTEWPEGEGGMDGGFDTLQALGGIGHTYAGNGGNGGGGGSINGVSAADNINAGGGGGAAGRLRMNYHSTCNAGTTSPTSTNLNNYVDLW